MTISKWTAVGIALGILLLGYGFGRFTTPSKVVERDHIVTSEHDTELTWHAYVGHTESKVETKTQWQTVTKWAPGGVVVQTVQAVQDHKEATASDVKESDGKVVERVVEKVVDHERVVEAAKPDWLVGVGVGTRLDKLAPVYDAEVGRRVLGPVFVAGWAQAAGASRADAAVGVRAVLLF